MLIFERSDDEILIGGLIYSRRSGKLRSAREIIEVILRDPIRPPVDDRISFLMPLITSRPVVGSPRSAWVVLSCNRMMSWRSRIFFSWFSILGTEGPTDSVWIAAGRLFADRFIPVMARDLPERMERPSGVFRFHPAVPAPDGSLYLPGWRISPDLQISRAPEADGWFQGVIMLGGNILPVSGFCAIGRDGERIPLHPLWKDLSGSGSVYGFLMWSDLEAGMALWAVYGRDDGKRTWSRSGSLELIDLRSMRRMWGIDRIAQEGAMALPDGRWVAKIHTERADHEEIVFGLRDHHVRRRVPGSVLSVRSMPSVFPLSGGRWIVACAAWFIVMNGLEEEDFVEAPLHPLLLSPDIFLVDDGNRVTVAPKAGASPSTIRKSSRRIHPCFLKQRGRLAVIKGISDGRFLLIPSFVLVKTANTVIDPPEALGFEVGDDGYIIVESMPFALRVIFFDSGGLKIAEHVVDGVRNLDRIVFFAGMFLILASGEVPASAGGEADCMRVLVFDQRGNPVLSSSLLVPPAEEWRICVPDDSPEFACVTVQVAGRVKSAFVLGVLDRREAFLTRLS